MKYLISIIPLFIFVLMTAFLGTSHVLLSLGTLVVSSFMLMVYCWKKKIGTEYLLTIMTITLLYSTHLLVLRKTGLEELTIPSFYFLLALILGLSRFTKRFHLPKILLKKNLKLKSCEWHQMTWHWIIFCLVCGSLYIILSLLPFISVSQWPSWRIAILAIIFCTFIFQQFWQYAKGIK